LVGNNYGNNRGSSIGQQKYDKIWMYGNF